MTTIIYLTTEILNIRGLRSKSLLVSDGYGNENKIQKFSVFRSVWYVRRPIIIEFTRVPRLITMGSGNSMKWFRNKMLDVRLNNEFLAQPVIFFRSTNTLKNFLPLSFLGSICGFRVCEEKTIHGLTIARFFSLPRKHFLDNNVLQNVSKWHVIRFKIYYAL